MNINIKDSTDINLNDIDRIIEKLFSLPHDDMNKDTLITCDLHPSLEPIGLGRFGVLNKPIENRPIFISPTSLINFNQYNIINNGNSGSNNINNNVFLNCIFNNISTNNNVPLINNDNSDLNSPTLSYNSRRNSLFSDNSFNYDSTDDFISYQHINNSNIKNKNDNNTNTNTTFNETNISINNETISKLRNSKAVKDKALLFEKLIQNEAISKNSNNTAVVITNDDEYSIMDDSINDISFHSISSSNNSNHHHNIKTISNNRTKDLSKQYLEQVEKDNYNINNNQINTKDPSKRIVSSKLQSYQDHIQMIEVAENSVNSINNDRGNTDKMTSLHNKNKKQIKAIISDNNKISYENL